MKLSLNWIKKFVEIPKKYSPEKLAELLTLRTCEVEEIRQQNQNLESVVVGEMLEFKKHPNAEKLHISKVDIGRKNPLQIIFGQMVQMKIGDRIPIAIAPTTLPTGIHIEKKDLRGYTSEGMLCLDQELGLKKEGVSITYFPEVKTGTPISQALGLNDAIFEIDNKSITNRPDLWGHYGIARELAAILQTPLKPSNLSWPQTEPKTQLSIQITHPEICRRFLAVTLNGIEIKSSPDWLQKRLTAVGVRPINNIVDATNYAMLETGQPLHAYDRACVETDTFIIRKAHAGEKLETLDHKIRMLSPDDAVVDNGKKLLGLAGIMGGIDSEISPDTKQIILESANWNPIIIRKTSQRLNIRTEASQRFEKNLDPVTHHQGFLRCLQLILELCPAAGIEGKIQDLNYYQWNQPQITLRIPNLNSKIGKKIPPQKIERILKSLEFTVEKTDSKTFLVNVPSFRATKDISNEYDLIEEVARLYGYENIPPHIPTLPIRLPEENIERRRKHETRAILSSMLGFNEVYNYSFYSRKDFAKTLLPEENHLTVENYLSEDQTHLRISLLPQLLKNCFENAKFYQQVKLFEIGRVYHKSENYFPSEEKWLAALLYRTEKTEFPFLDLHWITALITLFIF